MSKLANKETLLWRLRDFALPFRAIDSKRFRVPRSEVILLAPITGPDKVLCIGMNYKDHCEEQGAPVPTEPVVFNKFPSCIVGPTDPLPHPEVTKELDWEVGIGFQVSFQTELHFQMKYIFFQNKLREFRLQV